MSNRPVRTRSRNDNPIRLYAWAMTDVASIAAVPAALQSATGAIHRAVRALAKDADVVAKSPAVESRDTLDAMVDSRQQVLYTKAAAKIIDATGEMTKSLLDIRA
jgi:hypothetical protein